MNGYWIVLEWWDTSDDDEALPDAVHGPYFNYEEAELRAIQITKRNDSRGKVCHAMPHLPQKIDF